LFGQSGLFALAHHPNVGRDLHPDRHFGNRTANSLYDARMPNIGPAELIIVLVIVLVIFGPKRLPGLGRSLGTGMREFKDSVTGKSKDEEREQLEADARAHGEAEARHP
jgi:sec-independent protein translocase protein TatA